MARRFRCLALSVALAAGGVVGCEAGGTKFKVGDCISTQTNKNGEAVKADDCDSDGALKIEKLATGGQRPDCGTAYSFDKGMARYVHDLQTDITYCGW